MTHFFRQEIRQQARNFSAWINAFSLFAATCFIIGWPLRDDLVTTSLVGPSATLALLVLSQFLIFSPMWRQDTEGRLVEVLCAQGNKQIERYSRGRLAAAILVGWAYALVATATGTVLFSISLDGSIANMLKLLLISPALSAVAILTSAAVTGSSRNSTALGVVIMIPMIAPIVIFSGIYDAQSYIASSIWVNSLTSLLGLSIIYCTAAFFALPTILRAQT